MEAELTGTSGRRGGGSGDNYGERRRGSRSAIAGEGEGDEGERGEECRGCWASSWRSDGDEEAAGGGSRRWPREHAPATRLCLLAEVGDDWHKPGGLGQHR